ncbi:Rieske 2Fe-2S domain-containing protein [Candidatus Woesearchaeota archaeon]|nr:Rieske 2Fe-2S domain-containing protein [Candidatus Woesearchaeota archaeon]
MTDFINVADVNELKEGECKIVEINKKSVALFNINGIFYAIDNTCPHAHGPLGEGQLDGNTVTCPWHGWKFNVTTGISPVNPNVKVQRYDVKVEGDKIKLKMQ